VRNAEYTDRPVNFPAVGDGGYNRGMDDDYRKLSALVWNAFGPVKMTLYALSSGPMAWLDANEYLPESISLYLDLIYYPLELLSDAESPLFLMAFDLWIELWDIGEEPDAE
jgi:hypothetical protein